MSVTILSQFKKGTQLFIEKCTQCGACAKACPILPYTGISDLPSQEIQMGVYDFVISGHPNKRAFTKAFACMQCFRCTADLCPEGLNPLMINEVIKGAYITKGIADSTFNDSKLPDSAHRVLASIQVSETEYKRITTPTRKHKTHYVFFPGCNVYFQPEKILNTLDILDKIGDDYAFLPGLDYCCGDNHIFFGDIEEGSKRASQLIDALAKFQPEAVILWCPTCHCIFNEYIMSSEKIPFQVLSLPEYLADRMDQLPLTDTATGIITLHEACKSAFTGLDREGPRRVLRQLPGIRLREMANHGQKTACCGSGASCWFPEAYSRVCAARLEEAAMTGAMWLVTICHYCSQTFAAEEANYDFSITNYINLVAKAIGIHRTDKFKQYALYRDIELILEDAEDRVVQSRFNKKRIIEVLRSVFT
jgi:heterodisulfide reductase subunit D